MVIPSHYNIEESLTQSHKMHSQPHRCQQGQVHRRSGRDGRNQIGIGMARFEAGNFPHG